jgi:hypothetical protein
VAAAWSGPSGVDQLHLMAVRSRLAQLIAWRDAAARAGVCLLAASLLSAADCLDGHSSASRFVCAGWPLAFWDQACP